MLGIIGGNFGKFLKQVSPNPKDTIIYDGDPMRSECSLLEFLSKTDKVIIELQRQC